MKRFSLLALTLTLSLAACGGGGGGTSAGSGGTITPPTVPASTGNIPTQSTVKGAAAWVAPSTNMTLYTFDADTSATASACYGACATNWPPLIATAGAVAQGNFTLITRTDGSGQQWVDSGKPLYTFIGDTAPGNSTGDGIVAFGAAWHIARPASAGGVVGGGGVGGTGCTGYYC